MRPQPDAALISRQAVDVIENTLAPEMQQAMGTLTALRYREKPRPFAELYLSPAGKPRATVRVRRDGTIRVTRQGHDDQRTWPGDLPGKVAREIHSEIAAELTIRALRTSRSPQAGTSRLRHHPGRTPDGRPAEKGRG